MLGANEAKGCWTWIDWKDRREGTAHPIRPSVYTVRRVRVGGSGSGGLASGSDMASEPCLSGAHPSQRRELTSTVQMEACAPFAKPNPLRRKRAVVISECAI